MKLKKLKNKTWPKLVEFMETNCHALALETTRYEMEAAKSVMAHGPEAGAAVVVAALFLERYGAPRTAWKAVSLYESISDGLKYSLSWVNLTNSLSWVGSKSLIEKLPYPVSGFPDWDRDKVGGLANVMMMTAAVEMSAGSTTEALAAHALIKFLQEGLRQKEQRV